MKQAKHIPVALALALIVTIPIHAVVPERTDYVVFPGWSYVNSPFELLFVGLTCIDFDQDTTNWNLVYEDRGPYQITREDGPTTYVKATLNPNVGLLFQGQVTVHGTVNRRGLGSTFGWVGSGKLRSVLLAVPSTRVNVAGLAVQDSFDFLEFCGDPLPDPERAGEPNPNWVPVP